MSISVDGVLQIDTGNLGELSQLALVACDASYKGRLADGNEQLAAFHDTPQYGNPPPPFGFEFASLSANYRVDRTFEAPTDRTGFKAIAYRNAATNDVVLAFAGTDGLDVRDWWGNVFHVGRNQWQANAAQIQEYLDEFIVDPTTGQLSANIHFVGQSLGGALAQYAAYDFLVRHGSGNQFNKSKLSLITFNALGAVAGLSENVQGFDWNLLNGLGSAVHYAVENDIIHHLGDGHIGGQVRSFGWRNPNAPAGAAFNFLDPVEAHRIESAFYRYLDPARNFFAESKSTVVDYLDLPNLQKLMSAASLARTPTLTGRTSSCTLTTRSASPLASPMCLLRTLPAVKSRASRPNPSHPGVSGS